MSWPVEQLPLCVPIHQHTVLTAPNVRISDAAPCRDQADLVQKRSFWYALQGDGSVWASLPAVTRYVSGTLSMHCLISHARRAYIGRKQTHHESGDAYQPLRCILCPSFIAALITRLFSPLFQTRAQLASYSVSTGNSSPGDNAAGAWIWPLIFIQRWGQQYAYTVCTKSTRGFEKLCIM
jgi:hypothetical protein